MTPTELGNKAVLQYAAAVCGAPPTLGLGQSTVSWAMGVQLHVGHSEEP
jgi:hypothetical protein